MKRVTLAMTGGSGAQYSFRLLECLLEADCEISFLISDAGREVVRLETDVPLPLTTSDTEDFLREYFGAEEGQITAYDKQDWLSPVASGSGCPPYMVICPASGGTLSAIAHGLSNNLIERAADVVIKERKKLIVLPREMPVSSIHLENLLKLSNNGVVVMPASPGFYYKPETVDDLVDFVVARILDQLDIEHQLVDRWGC
ncbi:MAG: UbiX family flavin prenyltransferase [Pseudomonadales bacterium]|nr:UbiX family flavin prenyltransferase [Pseudomonadales bacterium]